MSKVRDKKTAPRTFASPVEGALFMAARRHRVFPLKPNTKDPFETEECKAKTPQYLPLAGGIHIATRNEKRIRKWAEICPDINFGVHAGDGVIIDFDLKDGKNGFATYEQRFGEEPDTFRVNTTTDGAHLYFDDEPCGQRSLDKENGLDIRSHNGYVVCPGSRIDGKSYTIARDVQRLPLPANIKEALAKVPERDTDWNKWMCEPDNDREIARAIEWLKSLNPIPEGYRNTDGFQAACVLKDLGLTAERAPVL